MFLTYYDGESMARLPLAFHGVELPALPKYLRAAEAPSRADWPPELRVLWALIAAGEDTLVPALGRANWWPGFNLNADPWPPLSADRDQAHRLAMDSIAAAEYLDGRNPELSLLQGSDHLVQLAMHCSQTFGYQQWFLFDTSWAASHPNLAQSLLRYAGHWDPLGD